MNPFQKDRYYSLAELSRVLGITPKTAKSREQSELKPDYIHPVTKKRFYLKQAINQKFLQRQ